METAGNEDKAHLTLFKPQRRIDLDRQVLGARKRITPVSVLMGQLSGRNPVADSVIGGWKI